MPFALRALVAGAIVLAWIVALTTGGLAFDIIAGVASIVAIIGLYAVTASRPSAMGRAGQTPRRSELREGLSGPAERPDQAADAAVPEEAPPATQRGADSGTMVAAATSAASPEPPPVAASGSSRPVILIQPDSTSPASVARALFRNAAAAGMVGSAHLWLVDPSSGTLRLIASAGPVTVSTGPESMAEGILAASLASGNAILEEHSRITTPVGPTTVWRYALPVGTEEARGIAAVDLTGDEPPDAAALNEVAAGMRSSLSGALALHVALSREQSARILMESVRRLARNLDEQQVIDEALDIAMELASAATGSVMLAEPDGRFLTIVASRGLPPEVADWSGIEVGEGIAGWVAASGQPLLIEDLPGTAGKGHRHGVRSAVSVPITDEDGLLGVLNVGSKSFPARFTEEHLNALEIFGRQVAVALRNARAMGSATDMYFDSLKALALALETKDPYAQGGTERVLETASLIGEAMGLAEEELGALRVAAMLHDIGMMGVGAAIGASDRPLTTVEQGLIKMHPSVAADILEQAPALRSVAPIVYHHHEWFDGTGYAGGLSGEDIPLASRILAVADAYVAMTSPRPYRPAKSHAQALADLEENAGSQFDPRVVEVFAEIQSAVPVRAPRSE